MVRLTQLEKVLWCQRLFRKKSKPPAVMEKLVLLERTLETTVHVRTLSYWNWLFSQCVYVVTWYVKSKDWRWKFESVAVQSWSWGISIVGSCYWATIIQELEDTVCSVVKMKCLDSVTVLELLLIRTKMFNKSNNQATCFPSKTKQHI
jgi:hypothetical protein